MQAAAGAGPQAGWIWLRQAAAVRVTVPSGTVLLRTQFGGAASPQLLPNDSATARHQLTPLTLSEQHDFGLCSDGMCNNLI